MSGSERGSRSSRAPLVGALLLAIVALGAALALTGLRWDAACPPGVEASLTAPCGETHLHPDERFLTMVATSIELPRSLADWFDPTTSPTNPHNRGHGFYVYGLLPVVVVKALGALFSHSAYDQIHLVGRLVSACCSLISIALLFLLARRLYDATIGLLAALLLALSVLPIQQAHFFTVDAPATAAALAALLAATSIDRRGRWHDYLRFGLALGLAVAIKVSVASLALLAVAAAFAHARRQPLRPTVRARFPLGVVAGLALAAFAAIALFRLLSPFTFAGPGLLDVGLNPAWVANMREIGELASGRRDFPPGHQWAARTPIWFPWRNMVLWGFGPALGIAAWIGWATAGWRLLRRREANHLLPWLWVTLLFGTLAPQQVASLRYFLPIYPALALLAARWLVELGRSAARSASLVRLTAAWLTIGAVVLGSAGWAWAFTAIYRRPHSRVEASRWIYEHVPPGSAITHDVWDDALPLPLDGKPGAALYRGLALHPFAEDTPEKLESTIATLEQADYVIVSSNRGYDSVARLPMRFPMTIRYYDALFSGALGFERVAEFASYPTLFGRSFPDQSAEEAFSVYDHPRVQIFAKGERWSSERARALLEIGDWDAVLTLSPLEARRYRSLELPPERLEQPRSRPTSAPGAAVAPESGSTLGALLRWIVALEWIGVVAFVLALPIFRRSAERGWLLARGLGLLVAAWLAWIGASVDAFAFGRPALVGVVAGLTLVAAAVAWRKRRELAELLAGRGRRLASLELLFWGAFAFALALRFGNPDLWHPYRGGEKPMDFAFFNAVVRSEAFPPHDPWFALGTLNYYYFGFVLAAALALLAQVPTAIAYNLAVPTFFALAAAAAAATALALVETRRSAGEARPLRLRWAWIGAVTLLLLGNQGVPKLIAERFAALGVADLSSRPPELGAVAQIARGAARWLDGASLELQQHWLYWSPSRAIPHPSSEPSPVTEFPFFTFLFADLHAHLMAMPLLLLLIALLVAACAPRAGPLGARERDAPSRLESVLFGAALSLLVGALSATNTWDLPIAVALVATAFLIRELERRPTFGAVAGAAWRTALVVAGSRLLFLPFHTEFAPAYGRFQAWHGSRTPLVAFLVIHALFLLPIVVRLLAMRRTWRRDALREALRGQVDRIVELAGLALAVIVGLVGRPLEALLVALVALATGRFLTAALEPRERFVAALVAAGALLALAVEHVVLVGDVGRMNTVFKIYLQIWLLWGTAAVASCAALLASARGRSPAPEWQPRPGLRRLLVGAGALLVAGALSYPVVAIPARLADRFDGSHSRGLDGRAFLATSTYDDEGRRLELRWDGEAIRWLERNVAGTPVILEATRPVYRWGSRFSVHTGLPTVLGWDWHEQQQRAILKRDPVGRRRADVAALYDAPDLAAIAPLLVRYRIRYVIVGELERQFHSAAGLAKFERGAPFREVYRNPGVVIYEVDRSAL